MTDFNAFTAPQFKNWQDFERFCRALMSRHRGGHFQLWGRPGQRQNGVDAYSNFEGKGIALQCKGRAGNLTRKLSENDVYTALAELETFPHPISEFFILTSAEDDVNIQSHVERLNQQQQWPFKITVLGWNSIQHLVAEHPEIQSQFFFHFFREKKWIKVALGITVTLLIFTTFAWIKARDLKEDQRNQSLTVNLHEMIKELDAQRDNLERCESFLNKVIYASAGELSKNCFSPLADKIRQIDSLFDAIAPKLPKEAFSEIHKFRDLMQLDLRDAGLAINMAETFDKKAVEHMLQLCLTEKNRDSELNAELEKALVDSLNNQLSFYFIVRDFSYPALGAMKARIIVHQRKAEGEELPVELIKEANELNVVLSARENYSFDPQAEPFTLSQTKQWYSRDIKISSNGFLNAKENMLRTQTLMTASMKSLVGKPAYIDKLISCKVLTPEARKLADPTYDEL